MLNDLEEGLNMRHANDPGAPRVSVVVPTYKASATLHEAVMSLLQQDYRDLEVIVVDDACPHGSSKVILGVDDPRLSVIHLEHNKGLSGARNAGIEASRGQYIAFMDADDTSLPCRVGLQTQLLDCQPDVGLVGGLHNRTDFHGRLTHSAADVWRLPDSALRAFLLFNNPFTSAVMIRRSALPKHGYRKMLCEDYAMVSDVARNHKIAMIRSAIINYRSNPSGIMANESSLVNDGAKSIKRWLLSNIGVEDSEYDESLLSPKRWLAAVKNSEEKTVYFEKYGRFLETILNANSITKIYPLLDLRLAISSQWTTLLLDASRGEAGLRFSPQLMSMMIEFWPLRGSRSRAKTLVRAWTNTFRPKNIFPHSQ